MKICPEPARFIIWNKYRKLVIEKIRLMLLRTAQTLVFVFFLSLCHSQGVYLTRDGQISFVSDAPLEVIRASSQRLSGAVDTGENTFAFSIPVSSFEGFNSALQREHFSENYMETALYPSATFTGRIIEDIRLLEGVPQEVRAKGMLIIHGVEQERIIPSVLELKGGVLHVASQFTVPLEDHNIRIPKIVNQKIAEVIEVTIEATLTPKKEE